MHNKKRSYDIEGNIYTCYFYSNGYDKWISVFDSNDKMLFKFDEPIEDRQVVVLLKGYAIGTKT